MCLIRDKAPSSELDGYRPPGVAACFRRQRLLDPRRRDLGRAPRDDLARPKQTCDLAARGDPTLVRLD